MWRASASDEAHLPDPRLGNHGFHHQTNDLFDPSAYLHGRGTLDTLQILTYVGNFAGHGLGLWLVAGTVTDERFFETLQLRFQAGVDDPKLAVNDATAGLDIRGRNHLNIATAQKLFQCLNFRPHIFGFRLVHLQYEVLTDAGAVENLTNDGKDRFGMLPQFFADDFSGDLDGEAQHVLFPVLFQGVPVLPHADKHVIPFGKSPSLPLASRLFANPVTPALGLLNDVTSLFLSLRDQIASLPCRFVHLALQNLGRRSNSFVGSNIRSVNLVIHDFRPTRKHTRGATMEVACPDLSRTPAPAPGTWKRTPHA